jgi:SAM-dependent methyltransferase
VVRKTAEAEVIKPLFDTVLILGDKIINDDKYSFAINSLEDIKKAQKGAKVELKVDTGMHRNGVALCELDEALELIEKAVILPDLPVTWTDLGCGSGVFTHALARLLPNDSLIYAIDKNDQTFKPTQGHNTRIEFIRADFERGLLNLPALDGILMANALHYVADKPAFLDKLNMHIKDSGSFIIVEYDTMKANPWVPYPINFNTLQTLFVDAGYPNCEKLGEKRSRYGGTMYACQFGK